MGIPIRLARRVAQVAPSPTLAITSKAKKLKSAGRDIVSLAAGEPDFDTPDFVKFAAIEAIKSGFTKYTPTTGTPELKKAISDKFKRDNFLDYASDQIVVSCGAKHSIFNALLALVDEGDEVIVPLPYWVSYPQMVHLCEGTPRFIPTLEKNSFKITPQELEKNITAKTKLLILNSPANPTGCVYSEEELKEISRVCVQNKILVLSDEIYEKIIYDQKKHCSIASLGRDIYELTITVNGLSKSHSMTGWRIGYLGAGHQIIEAVARIQDHSTSNPTSIAQKAALAALSAPTDFTEKMRQEFQKRRDYVEKRLKGIPRLTFIHPEGAFYIFSGIAQTGLDSITFAERLLEEAGVAVIPGEGFGRDDYMRLSFATSLEQLEKGMDRIEKWLKSVVARK